MDTNGTYMYQFVQYSTQLKISSTMVCQYWEITSFSEQYTDYLLT